MQWYNDLTSNEKNLIKFGVFVILTVLLWTFVYQPINQSIERKYKQKLELNAQLSQMQSSQDIFKQQQLKTQKYYRDINKPFISWVDEQLAKNQLSQFVTRSEPKDNQTLILVFESIVFDDLVNWLEPLELNFNVKISEVDVTVTDRSNGLCNVRITLEENK